MDRWGDDTAGGAGGGREAGAVVEDQGAAVAFLSDPAAHDGQPVEVVETHGAYVFIAGERAIKMKRAVWFPYMDFSTVEKRRAACEAELRLNRRSAPDLYEAVLPVTRDAGGGLALGGEGTVLDWTVAMRRFDQDTLFDRMAQRGRLDTALMEALADEIAAFHSGAERSPAIDFRASMRRIVDGNAASLKSWLGRPFRESDIERIGARCDAMLAAAGPALAGRARAGFVRRCHGDLHLRNICLVAGRPTLFDCIEFNDALAVIDVMYDLAFLIMDLEHRGLRPLANVVINRYLARTGDYAGLAGLRLYLVVRAVIRAHVAAATAAAQKEAARAARDRAEAESYLALAMRLSEPARPCLVAVGGLSGSGKTTLAHALAPRIGGAPGAVVIRSDVIRKQLFGVDLFERLPEEAYAREHSRSVFGRLSALAADALAAGCSVIADGVYRNEAERTSIRRIAEAAGAPFAGLWLEVTPDVQDERLGARRRDVSDATVAVGRAQRRAAPVVADWPVLDADAGIEALRDAAVQRLADSGIGGNET
jgi:aminoglycoside phosphotransferase family enzyme/predicted kinase